MSMSFLEAAYLVLKKTKRSIHYQDLMARIMDLDLVTTRGLTPSRTLNSILNVECKRPQSRFCSYRSGYFGLKECGNMHEPPPEVEKKSRVRTKRKTEKSARKAKRKKASKARRRETSAESGDGSSGSGSYSSMSSEARNRMIARRRRREARLLRQERRRLEAEAAAAAIGGPPSTDAEVAASAAAAMAAAAAARRRESDGSDSGSESSEAEQGRRDAARRAPVAAAVAPAPRPQPEPVLVNSTPVDYSMDSTDSKWLSQYNRSGRAFIAPARFEFFMDRFEKGTNSDTELVPLSLFHFPDEDRLMVEDVYGYWANRRAANGGRPLLEGVDRQRYVSAPSSPTDPTTRRSPPGGRGASPDLSALLGASGRSDPNNIVNAVAAILSRSAPLVPASVAYRSGGAPMFMAPSDVVSAVPSGAQTPIGGVDFGSATAPTYRFDYCAKCFGTSSVPSNQLVVCCGPCARWFHEQCVRTTQREVAASAQWRCPDCKAANAAPTSSSLSALKGPPNSTLSMINFDNVHTNPLTSHPHHARALSALGPAPSPDHHTAPFAHQHHARSDFGDDSLAFIHRPSAYAEFMESILSSAPASAKRKHDSRSATSGSPPKRQKTFVAVS